MARHDTRDERRRSDRGNKGGYDSRRGSRGSSGNDGGGGGGGSQSGQSGQRAADTLEQADMKGTIKRLVGDKGFGFIKAENGVEYFFHKSACLMDGGFESLREHEQVIFDAMKSAKGPRAQQVRDAFVI